MDEEKGKILYDESRSKKIIIRRIMLLLFGSFICFIPLAIILYGKPPEDLHWTMYGVLIFVILIWFSAGTFLIWAAITLGVAKVYENGFSNPSKTIIQTLRKNDIYIPVCDIIELYPNKNDMLDYITVKKQTKPNIISISKNDFNDLNAFLNMLNEIININWEKDLEII
jgi:hypothetical protein